MAKSKKKRSSTSLFLPLVIGVSWLFCVGSAVGVVYSTFESRKATQELEELRREASGLQVMSGQFLLERSSWATYSRVEDIATKKLNMKVPALGRTVLVYRKDDNQG